MLAQFSTLKLIEQTGYFINSIIYSLHRVRNNLLSVWEKQQTHTDKSSCQMTNKKMFLWGITRIIPSVIYQELPCTPQSQTSPLPPPPRTAEQLGRSAAPQTLSAYWGAPDRWISQSLSVVLLLHWAHQLQARGWNLYVEKYKSV